MKKFKNIEPYFPMNEWKIIENNYDINNYFRNETIFALANGYLGCRGSFEEGNKFIGHDGTYINGYYEKSVIKYGEKFVGYPEETQTMVNVANSKKIEILVDGELFDLHTGNTIKYLRELDLRKGVLRREIIWESLYGKRIKVIFERLVSFENKHLIAHNIIITPLNFEGEITLKSYLDGDVSNILKTDDPRMGADFIGNIFDTREIYNKEIMFLKQRTLKSRKKYACGVKEIFNTNNTFVVTKKVLEKSTYNEYCIESKNQEPINLTKFCVYYDYNNLEIEKETINNLNEITKNGWKYYLEKQEKYLLDFWNNSNITIKGNEFLVQGIRFNMFHLLQSTGKDGKTNIGAKGLTGEGYEGHYFWDTETYILPFFLYTKPEIAKKLLEFRYNTLEEAKERAKLLKHKNGALYPWRTINGEECSSYFPAGTAQYHINADIAYAIKKYYEITGDLEFIKETGIEILIETSRLWIDTGNYNEDGKFCINCVTGPDEYTALINNNYYTNLMASENMLFAYEIIQYIEKENKEKYNNIIKKLNVSKEEINYWKKASENIFLPFDEKLKINAQDDSFLQKPYWDLEKTDKKMFPLLLNYHPLVLYRYQVCKQADLILAQCLLPEKFDKEQIKKDFDYYEKITTHDSSLSTCIFSIVANYVGYYEKSYDYFITTARTDIDDYHQNTKDGIHAANMAGTWLCIVMGFGGTKEYNNHLHFEPSLPELWEEYSFKVNFRGRRIKVIVKKDSVEYLLEKGEKLNIYHFNEKIELSKKVIR